MNNILIFACGEPLAIDDKEVRLHRAGKLAKFLASKKKINIDFISSTFDHVNKNNRYSHDKLIKIDKNFNLHLLKTIKYKKNISILRLISNFFLGIRLYIYLKKKKFNPDLIFVAYPPIETSLALLFFSNKRKIPIVIDVRDLWPEIFLVRYNMLLKNILSVFLIPYHIMAKFIFIHAASIVSISNNMLKWIQVYAKRKRNNYDNFFPFSYQDGTISKVKKNKRVSFLKKKLEKKFNITYIGNISTTLELESLCKTAKSLSKYNDIQFVVCGVGDAFNEFKKKTVEYSNIFLTGWVNKNEISYILKNSKLGLIPYKNDTNLSLGIPNKFSEYISFSLPILTSLYGTVSNVIVKNKIGYLYKVNLKNDFKNKILLCYKNPSLLNKFSKNARKLFLQEFEHKNSHEKIFNHLKKVYHAFKN